MAPIHQDDMTESRVVAIWVGDHRDELDLDEYMMGQFEDDFGFTVNERRMPEIDSQPEPVPVAVLLKGFSMWENWYESAIAKCSEIGIEHGAIAVVFHFLTPEVGRAAGDRRDRIARARHRHRRR